MRLVQNLGQVNAGNPPFLDSLAFSCLLMLRLPLMAAPFSYYVLGSNHTFCLACKRQLRFGSNQYTRKVKCPYPDCRRTFFSQHHLTPVTSVPFKPPISEQIEPVATAIEPDS